MGLDAKEGWQSMSIVSMHFVKMMCIFANEGIV
jgi:hypothetical protein